MLGGHQRQSSYCGAGKILWPCSESNLDSLVVHHVALSQFWLSHPGSFFTDSIGTAIPWKRCPTATQMATLNKASSEAFLLRCYAAHVGSYLYTSWTATPLKMVLLGCPTTLANNYKCVTSQLVPEKLQGCLWFNSVTLSPSLDHRFCSTHKINVLLSWNVPENNKQYMQWLGKGKLHHSSHLVQLVI